MNWAAPTASELYHANDVSWPPIAMRRCGPFMIRKGGGGGQRVSSTSLVDKDFLISDIEAAEQATVALRQPLLFMIRDNDQKLDVALEARGYFIKDPVTLLAGPSARLAEYDPKGLVAIDAPEPLAIMTEIWAAGGITEGRMDVMRRAANPKACFLGRIEDQPAGVAYLACDGNIAMMHALEILPDKRRKGLARSMMGAMGAWSARNGAGTISLVVLSSNKAAIDLYRSIGMVEVGTYHYRKKDVT